MIDLGILRISNDKLSWITDSIIRIWVNYNDLTSRPNPGIMVYEGNHPQMAELFRLVLVIYYNLPRLESYGLLE